MLLLGGRTLSPRLMGGDPSRHLRVLRIINADLRVRGIKLKHVV